ncbi:MAG: hypothetical protein IJP31_01185 [Lachnospiraceae bacterium]|nr:hypothetical protein [Lachnospiraceae bacterium]
MRAVGIVVEPFGLVNVLRVEGIRELNRHGSLKITGMIRQEKEKEYRRMAMDEVWVKVDAVGEGGEREKFFCGLLTSIFFHKENQLSVVTLEIKTGSWLLDLDLHTRSFQQSGISYQKIINTCMEAAGGYAIVSEKENRKTDRWFMQYQETDWQFLSRLASHMGVPLMAESRQSGKKLYLGYSQQEKRVMDSREDYRIEQDFGEMERKEALNQRDVQPGDAVSYVVSSREIYSLGSRVIFEDKELLISEIRTWLKGQELYHEYRLCYPSRGILPPYRNPALSGASLSAWVTAVEKTMVQVELLEDENKADCGARWLDYATVYSTPDGTGWYCMPEVGDEVRLVFPDRDEEHAYVAGSVHLGAAGGRDRPQEKYWRNKQNKEILFTPDAIILRNNQGLSLELSDEEGIKLVSDKDILLQAEGQIQMKSQGEGIHMAADSKILLQQGTARIEMSDAINIGGGKIYMN